MFDKTGKVFLYLIFAIYTTSVVLMLVSIFYFFTALILGFQNGGRPPPWIFVISQYLSKI